MRPLLSTRSRASRASIRTQLCMPLPCALDSDVGPPCRSRPRDATICPTTPLALGAHCKLLALSGPCFHTADPLLGLTPLSARAVYDTYDPHIEGPLVAVRTAPAPSNPGPGISTGTGALVLVLRNTCAWNPVAYAHITVPYVPGLTVHPALAAHARAPTPAPAPTPFPATAPRRNSCAYPPLLPPLTHLHTPYSEGDKDAYKRIDDERRSATHDLTHARTSVPPVLEEGVTILAHGPPVPARAPRSPYFDFDEPRAEEDVVAALKRAAGLGLGAGAGARRQRSASASGRC